MLPPHDAPLTEKFSFWLTLLRDVQHRGEYYVSCCPAHDDDRASLVTQIGEKGIVATCHAGCTFPQICHAAGVTASWMFEKTSQPAKKEKQQKRDLKETGSWIYFDELGETVFRTVRLEDGTTKENGKPKKEFRQQSPDGKGGWKGGVKDVRVIPYRLPDVVFSSGIVLIVEGEKHCDRLAELGFVATCNAGGAADGNSKNKWKPEHSEFLRDRDVVILPDNDKPGRNHARNVAASLVEHGVRSVNVCILPGLKDHGDVIDWLDAGGTKEQLQELIEQAKPVRDAFPEEDTNDKLPPPITNHDIEYDDEEPKVVPLPMSAIIETIQSRTDGFPKRVGPALFIKNGEDSISWLNNSASLFGWLGTADGQPANIRKSSNLHSQQEIYAELQRTADSYDAVETLPHYPPIPKHYYACKELPPGDGETLERLIDFYSPESDVDRDLIKAMFVTAVVWGGPGGRRPVFVITSDTGRGAGKTTLSNHVAMLAGGYIELASNEDVSQIKQRLLSPEGMNKRVAIIDNIKSLRFSWAEFEALVTAPVISGKRMYVGEGQRPGTLTFILTINGLSFSKDISQRALIIKLGAPRRSGTWSEDASEFIRLNRDKLIADCIEFLQRDAAVLERHTRWSDWETAILSRLPDPDLAQRVVMDRQQLADADDDESGLIQEGIENELRKIGYYPHEEKVFLPSKIVVEWISDITKERGSTASISRRLKQWITEGTVTQIRVNRCNAWGRGFIWESATSNGNVLTDIEARIEESRQGGKF